MKRRTRDEIAQRVAREHRVRHFLGVRHGDHDRTPAPGRVARRHDREAIFVGEREHARLRALGQRGCRQSPHRRARRGSHPVPASFPAPLERHAVFAERLASQALIASLIEFTGIAVTIGVINAAFSVR